MGAIMKKSRVALLACLASALALPGLSMAETRTITWSAVTTYNDGTPIESNVYITYNMYWSSDAGLSAGSLRPVVSSAVQPPAPSIRTSPGCLAARRSISRERRS